MARILSGARDFILRTTRHPLGFIGVNLAGVSGILLAVLMIASVLGFQANPYIGAVTFLVLPAIFLFGLLLIPIGSWRYRRRLARQGATDQLFPVYDLNDPRMRNRMLFIGAVTVANLTIFATVSYKGVEYMDSVEFCGEVCHPVMEPELTVYRASPHSRVRCIDCHIGPGASWFVKSKLSGTRQVIKQVAGTWPTPIETPVHNLRPSRDTCEQCHWPEKFHGDKVWVRTHYQEDEKNTPLKTVLLLKIGGGNPESGFSTGIHWHILNQVYYRSDERRETIPWVRVERLDGSSTEYLQSGLEELPDSIAQLEPRLMDCIDCHNRPTHIYRLPSRAFDEAAVGGLLPLDLPYLKREALNVLAGEYPDDETAMAAIHRGISEYYRTTHPELYEARASEIHAAISKIKSIWQSYVHPEMKITWGTYPDHIGHQDFTGCFRCHDEDHVSKDGATISQDCTSCHSLLAVEEENPSVLRALFPEE